MEEAEAEDVKKRITEEGRSPTMIVNCSEGHELLVTLYMNGGKLGVRDVMVPVRSGTSKTTGQEKPSEIEWVKKTFGGTK
ncbi:MAG: hypothetical protein R6V83_12975 [Candidatus Thorarchaeota archaeon]